MAERGKRKTPDQHKKLAQLLSDNVPVGEALVQAGWSERQAKKGMAAVPDKVLAVLPKKMKRLINLGKMDKERRKDLIRGRLVDNIVQGKDGGAQSAKILGSDQELNLWTPDQQLGVIVLNAPQRLLDNKDAILAEE